MKYIINLKGVGKKAVLKMGTRQEYLMAEAATLIRYPKYRDGLENLYTTLIIDPQTNRALQGDRNKNIRKLEYSLTASKINKLHSDPDLRLNKVVIPCLDFQREHGAGVLIVPYLLIREVRSISLSTNLAMITDSIKYRKINNLTLPLWAFINIHKNILAAEQDVKYLISKILANPTINEIDGFIIQVDQLNDIEDTSDLLVSLSKLCFQLSQKKNVYIMSIGGFGELLSTAGVSGIISAAGKRDVSNVDNYINPKSDGKYNNKRRNFVYYSPLYNYVNVSIFQKVNYDCNCSICNGNTIPNDETNKQIHFILSKIASLSKQAELQSFENLNTKITEAISFIEANKTSIGSALDRQLSALKRWKHALEIIQHALPLEDDDESEINDLLANLE